MEFFCVLLLNGCYFRVDGLYLVAYILANYCAFLEKLNQVILVTSVYPQNNFLISLNAR